MIPRWKRQLGGLALVLIGASGTAYIWHKALTEGSYPVKAAALFPGACIVGLAAILFPGPLEERLARGEDVSQLSSIGLLTPKSWTVLLLALPAGAANLLLLASGPASVEGMDAMGVAVDATGSLFISDSGNSCVWRVGRHGKVARVAGTGVPGFSGDLGKATDARLFDPAGIAFGPDGSLYIADYTGGRVRRVDPQGAIGTVAGCGEEGFCGDGGPAVSARLGFPCGIAVNSQGDIFVGDQLNDRVRRVNSSGTITTVAGSGELGLGGDGRPATKAPLSGASWIALGTGGVLYIAESRAVAPIGGRVRKVDARGIMSILVGGGRSRGDGGPAARARLECPAGLATDTAGALYIADCGDGRVRKVDAHGVIRTVWQAPDQRSQPRGICAAGDHLYIATEASVIRLGPNGSAASVVLASEPTEPSLP